MKYTIFIPVRKGSQRVHKKNTRDFSGIKGGLLAHKLNQLQNLKADIEILVSTNDPESFTIAQNYKQEIRNLRIIDRSDYLGTSSTPLVELIKHAGEVASAPHILFTHVTSPFCDESHYRKALSLYEEKSKSGYDSLISGRIYKEFLFDKVSGEIVNNKSDMAWPRTQDLPDWFEINNAVFLTSKAYFEQGRRIGERPFLYEQDKIVSLDIDDEDDFKIAEAVYEKFY